MPATATPQGVMGNIAMCEAIFWKDGVPAEIKLTGIGRLLGFEREATETETTATANTDGGGTILENAAQNNTRNRRTRNAGNAGSGASGGATRGKRNAGKAATTGNAGGTRQPRRGSKRDALLDLIRDGGGLSRGDILERMGLKGDKAGEMSVSNALTALTKRNKVRRESGRYFPAVETVQQGTMGEAQAQAA